MSVTPEFKEASTRAAIRALRGLEQTAIMLETYAPDLYPETNEVNGVVQKHFGRVMMESAAQAIRDAWLAAIVEIEAFPADPANLIESHGRLRQALLEIAVELRAEHSSPRHAEEIALTALKSNLLPVGAKAEAAAAKVSEPPCRQKTNICDPVAGECMRCRAAQGEACREPAAVGYRPAAPANAERA